MTIRPDQVPDNYPPGNPDPDPDHYVLNREGQVCWAPTHHDRMLVEPMCQLDRDMRIDRLLGRFG